MVEDLEKRSKEKFKKRSMEKSSIKEINLYSGQNNKRVSNINKRQQNNSREEEQSDTKFYLNDGLKNDKKGTNNLPTHRRSKSFSPNHFNRTNPVAIDKRYK